MVCSIIAAASVRSELEHQQIVRPRCGAGDGDVDCPVRERRVIAPHEFDSHVVTERISAIAFLVSALLVGGRQSQLATPPCREQVPRRLWLKL